MTFMSPFLRRAVRQLEKSERDHQGRIIYTVPTSGCSTPLTPMMGVTNIMGSSLKMSIDERPVLSTYNGTNARISIGFSRILINFDRWYTRTRI